LNKKYHNPRVKRISPQWIAETQKKNRIDASKQKSQFKGGYKVSNSDKKGDR